MPCEEAVVVFTCVCFSEVVKEYIQEAKAHMSKTCQDMEVGLSLTSHYVDMKMSQREILRSGKNTNKFLDKELVIMGHTDRQKSLLGQRQVYFKFFLKLSAQNFSSCSYS